MVTWRPVPGHDGYEVSDDGQVRSYRTRPGHPSNTPRLMAPQVTKGYRFVKLGRGYQGRVHNLMLMAFVGPRPTPEHQGRHLDGNPLNNTLVNLAWGTPAENYNDRRAHGTDNTGERHGRARLTDAIVREARAAYDRGGRAADLAAQYGVPASTMQAAVRRRTWRHL